MRKINKNNRNDVRYIKRLLKNNEKKKKTKDISK